MFILGITRNTKYTMLKKSRDIAVEPGGTFSPPGSEWLNTTLIIITAETRIRSRLFHVGFVVDKVSLVQVSLSEYLGLHLLVSFYQSANHSFNTDIVRPYQLTALLNNKIKFYFIQLLFINHNCTRTEFQNMHLGTFKKIRRNWNWMCHISFWSLPIM